MNELVKSIRVGAVDFFGIIIPGILLIATCTLGFFAPMILLIADVSNVAFDWQKLLSENSAVIVSALIIFAYVLGYILRLSSPDQLDQISARNVILQELERRNKAGEINAISFKVTRFTRALVHWLFLHRCVEWMAQAMKLKRAKDYLDGERKLFEKFIDIDGWPYNPGDPLDKYPYSHFREYLKKRGHEELIESLVTWCPDADWKEGAFWENELDSQGRPIPKTKRSKSDVNELKMKIRIKSPELSGLVESKEGHIRLMAGTWAAFKFCFWPVLVAFLVIAVLTFLVPSLPWCRVYLLVNFGILTMLAYSNDRIEKLFHYRRVSELFHIVQAAYLAK